MKKFFLYPINIFAGLLICLLLSALNFSYIYNSLSFNNFSLFLLPLLLFLILYFLCKRKFSSPKLYNNNGFDEGYKIFMAISFFGFFLEFYLKGVPIFMVSGRDEYQGLPFFHVVFYSSSICAVLLSALFSSRKALVFSFIFVVMISILTLSRQLFMVSFLIIIISTVYKNGINKKLLIKIIFFSVLLIVTFGFIGNLRQMLAGDYTSNYILNIGGANSNGELLGEVLYWIWLYMSSPIYNLIFNIEQYNNGLDICYNDSANCMGYYISSFLLPNTLVKYFGFSELKVDLIVEYLNASTGFAQPARLLGVTGIFIQIFIQFLFYIIGFLIMPIKIRSAYFIYFSALSFFMIFDNLFLKGEFFFCFVLIYFYCLSKSIKIKN